MKTAIVYVSEHHGNTKKLVDAIASAAQVDVIDAAQVGRAALDDYELIGFASGVAFGKYYPQLLAFMRDNLPEGRPLFLMHTAGDPRETHAATARAIADERRCTVQGVYFCKGFDTYGPFKMVGGIAKGHPTRDEIDGAVRFYEAICQKLQG